MTNLFPKLHNAMWPGLVGKGDEEGGRARGLRAQAPRASQEGAL